MVLERNRWGDMKWLTESMALRVACIGMIESQAGLEKGWEGGLSRGIIISSGDHGV